MAERSEGSCSLSPASSRLCRVSLLLLHAITAKGWHFPIGSRMQQVCSLSAWLEAIGLRLGPMRVLRPAGRDVERQASQYMCGFLSESAWENNCLEEFRLYLKVHEKSSEQNLAGMCLISGRWYTERIPDGRKETRPLWMNHNQPPTTNGRKIRSQSRYPHIRFNWFLKILSSPEQQSALHKNQPQTINPKTTFEKEMGAPHHHRGTGIPPANGPNSMKRGVGAAPLNNVPWIGKDHNFLSDPLPNRQNAVHWCALVCPPTPTRITKYCLTRVKT